MADRKFVTPDDVQSLATPVLAITLLLLTMERAFGAVSLPKLLAGDDGRGYDVIALGLYSSFDYLKCVAIAEAARALECAGMSFVAVMEGGMVAWKKFGFSTSRADDVLTRFKKEGLLNPVTAGSWRDEVLSKGGGVDEREMITRFLGRAPNHDAYLAYIKGEQ